MEYGIWKQKLVKSYLNKTSVFETERLQDSVWREGLQDYKITREEGLQKYF